MHRQRWTVLLAIALSLTLLPSAEAAAPGVSPRLRLIPPSRVVDVYRVGDRAVSLQLPVYIASLDAPFDLRIQRDGYEEPIRVSQALHGPSKVDLVELPTDVLDGWNGLAGFFRVRVYSTEGTLLRRATSTICPGGWEAQRVDDSGPYQPTYPSGCSAWPFSLGAVWGIDQGWGVIPTWMSNARVRLPVGTYRAVVSIAGRYRTLFDIADADASAELRIRVRRYNCEFCYAPEREAEPAEGSAFTAAPIDPDPDPATVADLVALPAFSIGIDRARGRDYLRFAANVWNRGPASLVVEGFRAEGEERMDAYQYFFEDGAIVGRSSVGSFEFDRRDGHHHWHFLQFARYRLIDATLDHVVRSKKQAFCLAPTDSIDLTVDGAVWRTDEFGWSQCGWDESIWIREVLPTGWGDTYYQGVPGQSFDITELPNGTYWVEVTANPQGLLFDADPSNDTELREVVLGGTPGARTVIALPWHGIDV
ncbi:MAG TPA: lysyl oxidase family protein [Actinomycetota bacterium]